MHGIYGCYGDEGILMYVGSSSKNLDQLEYNHRNYQRFGSEGYGSNFRVALSREGANWKFVWLQTPRDISRTQCEIEEGALIRYLKPRHNFDKFPYENSVRRGRMEQI